MARLDSGKWFYMTFTRTSGSVLLLHIRSADLTEEATIHETTTVDDGDWEVNGVGMRRWRISGEFLCDDAATIDDSGVKGNVAISPNAPGGAIVAPSYSSTGNNAILNTQTITLDKNGTATGTFEITGSGPLVKSPIGSPSEP
jgi:hypothetical protein